jgi:ornithine cyclodeaminase/alanine dehydrogenase
MADEKLTIPETLFLTDADVRSSFDWVEASAALRRAYSIKSAPGQFPPRTMARHDGCWLRVLSGIEPDAGVMGIKIIAASMKVGAVSYLIPLYDLRTMALLCLMDANAITGFRTAATTALALDILANLDARRVAVIGSGFEAKTHVRALAAVRSLDSVTVYSPRPESRARFIEELSDLGVPMDAADSAEGAVADAGIILCAARSRDETPTLRGAWLKPGMTVASIGSTLQEQREVDPDTIAAAALIVADMPHEVADETGDMLAATAADVQFSDRLIALDELVSGAHPGRVDKEQIILYKSVGSAIQDIVVAAMCFRRSQELGIGTPMPATIIPVRKGK